MSMRTPSRVVLAQERGGVRATPAYRSAQATGPAAKAERHSVSGTTPGATRGTYGSRADVENPESAPSSS